MAGFRKWLPNIVHKLRSAFQSDDLYRKHPNDRCNDCRYEKVAVDCDKAILFAVSFDEVHLVTYVNNIWSILSESQKWYDSYRSIRNWNKCMG